MKYAYDLTGAEVIIKDMAVYDATALEYGELLMLGTTDPDSATDEGQSLVTAYSATAANSAVDAVGILNESTYGTGGTAPTRAASTTTGPYYGKVIINPFAVYAVEQNIGTSYDVAITSTSTTTLTVSSLQDDIDGCWAYFPLTASGVKGSLRYITAAASGSCTMDSALTTTGNSSDTVVLIAPPPFYSFNLTADALQVASGDCQATVKGATNLRIVQTYIDKGEGEEIMRPNLHYALNNLHNCRGGAGPRFFYHIMMKDHLYGVQE